MIFGFGLLAVAIGVWLFGEAINFLCWFFVHRKEDWQKLEYSIDGEDYRKLEGSNQYWGHHE